MRLEPGRKYSILLVDDNPTNLNVLWDALRHDGLRLLVAKSGEEAIQRAELAKPELILLDVLMPGIDGFETCRRLKENPETRVIPVIFMTALADTIDKVRGFSLGAVDYITKPFQQEEVMARVETHLVLQDLRRELQQKNDALNRALDHEKELNRLKTGMVSMASHELRRPLTVLSLYSKSLLPKDPGAVTHDQRDAYQKIQKSVRQMTQLLDDVLIATQSETGKLTFEPELADLEDLCRKCAADIQLIDEYSHQLEMMVSASSPVAVVDTRLVQRVVLNLLSNAVKYSPRGTTIRFRVDINEQEAMIQVSDDGIGISKADQEKLFESFQRGGNVGKIAGSGLGLSIVKQCLDLHRGRIHCDSEPNKGTTFSVWIPVRIPVDEPLTGTS